MAEPRADSRHYVVVGVVPGQSDKVVTDAAALAERLGAELVCANVDITRYTIEELPDGSVAAFPVDPDQAEIMHDEFDPALTERITHLLEGRTLRWSTRALAGEPAAELARLAEELDAWLIVVGTRGPGFRASAREFFTGSVAVHLAHRQPRPVVVVPLAPVAEGSELPWS
jgi:nucleotide-binding universal stress UspA family protein